MQIGVKIDEAAHMEDLQLLGSRYIRSQQVVQGPVQTFRAQNAATWREVFIHRVSSAQEAAEQAELLKLLTTALVRSPEAKRLVLDFGEEQGYWNVVTENEPQCESLREWLQAEISGSRKSEALEAAEQAAALGEFARLFARDLAPPPGRRLGPPEKAPPPRIAPVIQPQLAMQWQPSMQTAAAVMTAEPIVTEAVAPAPVVQAEVEVPAPVKAPPTEAVVEAEAVSVVESEPVPVIEQAAETPIEEPPAVVVPAPISFPPPPRPGRPMASAQTGVDAIRPVEDARLVQRPSQSFTVVQPSVAWVVDPPPAARLKPLVEDVVVEAIPASNSRVVVEPVEEAPVIRPGLDAAITRPPMDTELFATSMPRRAGTSKMTVFFIILGIVTVLLVAIIVYLSTTR